MDAPLAVGVTYSPGREHSSIPAHCRSSSRAVAGAAPAPRLFVLAPGRPSGVAATGVLR